MACEGAKIGDVEDDVAIFLKGHPRLLADLVKAMKLVRYGNVTIHFSGGRYIGLDACPRERIQAIPADEPQAKGDLR